MDKFKAGFDLTFSTAHHLFTALSVLSDVARERYNSPSATQQRQEFKAAGAELAAAFKDWKKFVEVLSSVADKFKFGPSELGVISRVNQTLLDSMERLGGGSGKLVLLIFIAVWKTTYIVLRSAISLLVAVARGLSALGRQMSKMISDYLHTQIQELTRRGDDQQQASGFFGSSVNAPPSIRKTVLYLLSGALLVGAPVAVLAKYVFPAFFAVLQWMWTVGTYPLVKSSL